MTNPLGEIVQVNTYSPLGDPLSVSVYPDTGNPATSLTPLTTTITYNAAQLPQRITMPNGVYLDATLNNGALNGIALGNQGVTRAQATFSRDSRGRVYAASDLVGSLAQFKYDKNSNLTRVLDGRGNSTRVYYGAANEPTSIQWPLNQTASLQYDALGRIRAATDERGVASTLTYDDDSRFTNLNVPATANTPAESVSVAYDSAGRVTQQTDSSGSRTYTYDAVRKRLTSVQVTINALPPANRTFTISYAYYPDGNLSAMTTPAGTTAYYYDKAGQLIRLTDPQGNSTQWTYDFVGRVTSEYTTASGGTTFSTTYAYGVSGQAGDPSAAPAYLRTITHRVNNQVVWTYTLTHSYLGQLLTQSGVGSVAGQQSSDAYAYDNRGRLASSANSFQLVSGSPSASNGTYSYDLANNLQGGAGGWSYNANNQVTTAGALGGMAGGTGLTYDAAGNLTAMNGSVLSYDGLGRLTQVTNTPFGTVTYAYDGAGRRISKTVSGTTTYFLWAGGTLLAELNGSGQVTRSYSWGTLGLISDQASGSSRFYLYDGRGHTRALLDASGTTLGRGAYSAYGSSYGGYQPSSPFGWNGRWGAYRDSETGFYQMGARYYSPALGRFLRRDPSGFWGGVNLYTYCSGDPANFYDVSGLYHEESEKPLVSQMVDWIRPLDIRLPLFDLPLLPPIAAVTSLHDSFQHWGGTEGKGDAERVLGMNKVTTAELWGARFNALFQLGANGFVLGKLVASRIPCRFGGPVCFPAGTLVQVVEETPSNATKKRSDARIVTKPIEQVKQGDTVVSRDERTGKTSYQKVTQTFVRQTDALLTIDLATTPNGTTVESLQATREHPFYVRGKGFVPAGGLAVGNAIVTRAGPDLYVRAIRWQRQPEGWTVYNFAVQQNHSYFVGTVNGGVWAHNNNGNCIAKPLKEWLDDVPELLDEVTEMFKNSPEWWGIDPDNTPVFYRNKDSVDEIRSLPGEDGGHHPHGLALGGPQGQTLTITNETRTVKNPTHSKVTGLQRRVINIIKRKIGL